MSRPVGRWCVLVGMWPVESGKVIGSRPCGSTSPSRTDGEGGAGLDAGVPHDEHGVGEVEHLAEVERAAGVDDGDERLAEGRDGAQHARAGPAAGRCR